MPKKSIFIPRLKVLRSPHSSVWQAVEQETQIMLAIMYKVTIRFSYAELPAGL